MEKIQAKCFLTLSLWIIALGLFAQTEAVTSPPRLKAEQALRHYVELEDEAYQWEHKESYKVGKARVHHLLLTSQKWREYVWTHQLTLFVPEEVTTDLALLFISGGSNQDGEPRWSKNSRFLSAMAELANHNKAIVTLLRQIPNQPLFDGKVEDELISFTLHQFTQEKDFTWPLLFPMVKGAVKAMDAVQEFSGQTLGKDVEGFLVSGASKRGWTSWLTAAVGDERVKAIAPMVIDVLNMPVNLKYQLESYGEYSDQINDYVKLGIIQGMDTEEGKILATMIDPYSYREQLRVPKMIFIGTNDPYWTVDAIKNYWNEIPGKNLIHYVPNAGHDLDGGKQALTGLSAFFALTALDQPYPTNTWNVREEEDAAVLSITLNDPSLQGASLWSATSADRDFRDEKWRDEKLKISDTSTITLRQAYPQDGYMAFYVDLRYRHPHGGSYTVSTRVFLMDSEEVL